MSRWTLLWFSSLAACTSSVSGNSDAGPADVQRADVPVEDVLAVRRSPLDRRSPWPKFRGNIEQDGRVDVTPFDDGSAPWVFQTGKGIFSTPVIDGDGVVYVGSADRNFYAIGPDGRERWRLRTGEIIDSSALLDDQSRVYFGSGDGYLYALNRRDGTMAWRFQADEPSTNNAFIRWFEGNVGMTEDGTLVAPNDNFCTYGIAREDGARRWCFRTNDQTWSLPAYDIGRQLLLMGNNFLLGSNVFGINAQGGTRAWAAAIPATVAASPMYMDRGAEGTMVVGGFDGYVRALTAFSGTPLWQTGLRDHIYASPARLSDGTIIQPAADGTVYALDPEDGRVRWSFDTLEPIRSSPAVDAQDHIYFGSGEGRLFVLNPDGLLRWSIRLISDDRDDLNASVALAAAARSSRARTAGCTTSPTTTACAPRRSPTRAAAGDPQKTSPPTARSCIAPPASVARCLSAPRPSTPTSPSPSRSSCAARATRSSPSSTTRPSRSPPRRRPRCASSDRATVASSPSPPRRPSPPTRWAMCSSACARARSSTRRERGCASPAAPPRATST
ncbi:MAG: PQQ-binding-like beta-propeller repeat protein [Polyangiales bacterium]